MAITKIKKNTDNSTEAVSLSELMTQLNMLEVEIHHRGELSVTEINLLLAKLYIYFSSRSIYPANRAGNCFDADMLCTRVAALLSLWASSEDLSLSSDELKLLLGYKELISSIFYNSGFRGTRHLKTYAAVRSNGNLILPFEKVVVVSLLTHIDDVDVKIFELAKKLPTEIFSLLLLGWLNTQVILTEQGEFIRNELYRLSDSICNLSMDYKSISFILNSWMYSGYSNCPLRIKFKENLNRMIKNHFLDRGISFSLQPKIKKNKPKILVIHERAQENHAMMRCYEHMFKNLQTKFETVSLVCASQKSKYIEKLFNSTVYISDKTDFKSILSNVKKISPDIVYYPSIGMSHWTILLSNLRLAPIQLMTAGHPDSSRSTEIDYIFVGPNLPEIAEECSEKLLYDDNYNFDFTAHSEYENLKIKKSIIHSDFLNIAINCSSMKLSPDFICFLKRIREKSNKKVKFHFFPSGQGFNGDLAYIRVRSEFPNDYIYSLLPYSNFLECLSKCELSLTPFPFGNTNSHIDVLSLGIPVLCMKNRRLSGFVDEYIMKKFGLEQCCINGGVSDYESAALQLINSNERLLDLAHKITTEFSKVITNKQKPSQYDHFLPSEIMRIYHDKHKFM